MGWCGAGACGVGGVAIGECIGVDVGAIAWIAAPARLDSGIDGIWFVVGVGGPGGMPRLDVKATDMVMGDGV